MDPYNVPVKEINLRNISPYITYCSHIPDYNRFPAGYRHTSRPIYDYEIEYFPQSGGAIVLNGAEYKVRSSDIVFKRPGMFNQGIAPYTNYWVSFNLVGESRRVDRYYVFQDNQEFQCNYRNEWLDRIPVFSHAESTSMFDMLFQNIYNEYIKGSSSSIILLRSYLLQLLYYLHPDSYNNLDPHISKPSAYYGIFKKVCGYIDVHLKDRLNLGTLAEIAGLDPFHFHKIFTRHFEVTPAKYITRLRMEKARNLLVQSNMPVTEIAVESGIPDLPHFCKTFRKSENISPGEFRRLHAW